MREYSEEEIQDLTDRVFLAREQLQAGKVHFAAHLADDFFRSLEAIRLRADGKVDLPAMLRDLGQRGINELHVEAGHKLNGSLLRAGLVDELLVYLAPKLLGPGLGLANLGPLDTLDGAQPLEFTSVERVGPDLRVLARVPGRGHF